MSFQSGIIAILGKPNSGKSTLLNKLVGQKVAAVTEKPQTTRKNIRGIRHTDTSQMVFIDTPGFHRAKKSINKWMVHETKVAIRNADLCVMLVPVDLGWKQPDELLFQTLKKSGVPFIIAITKIDPFSKARILPLIEKIQAVAEGIAIIPISALYNDGLDVLVKEMEARIPEGEPLYPPDQPTDQTMRELAAEMIREKLFAASRQEIPYSLAVQIEIYEEPRHPKEATKIGAAILVERKSQKMIIIGKKGHLLKKVGTIARKELESIIGGKVFLSLFVKVAEDWTKNPKKRQELGYG